MKERAVWRADAGVISRMKDKEDRSRRPRFTYQHYLYHSMHYLSHISIIYFYSYLWFRSIDETTEHTDIMDSAKRSDAIH
jgi:hypothetical protein